MTPEERKSSSEQFLRKHSITAYAALPLIESEHEVRLRSPDELLRRIIALWAVVGTAFLKQTNHFRDYVLHQGIQSWLSERELAFLLSDDRSERDYIQFGWRLEALYFLAWCAGLIEEVDIPTRESSVEGIMHYFPVDMEEPTNLKSTIRLRGKREILDWADRLYRLHWVVRDARLNDKPVPANVVGGAVQEWHQAVNWVTNYGDEDNWDHIGTDT